MWCCPGWPASAALAAQNMPHFAQYVPPYLREPPASEICHDQDCLPCITKHLGAVGPEIASKKQSSSFLFTARWCLVQSLLNRVNGTMTASDAAEDSDSNSDCTKCC